MKVTFILVLTAILLPIAVVASWLATEQMIELTSGEEFCTGCHTMEPMGKSYQEDVHGGKSSYGAQVKCVDCHLPHDNLFNYLVSKAITGTHDVWAQYTYDLDSIDWEEKRQHREKFVYDSGCMKCHSNLERATMADHKAFVAHKPYFLRTTSKKCVSCHKNVGHHNLGSFLSKTNKHGELK